MSTKLEPNELIDRWSRGADVMHKIEFRQYVRELLDTNRNKTNPADVDTLFDSFGDNEGGDSTTKPVPIIKQAFKTLPSSPDL